MSIWIHLGLGLFFTLGTLPLFLWVHRMKEDGEILMYARILLCTLFLISSILASVHLAIFAASWGTMLARYVVISCIVGVAAMGFLTLRRGVDGVRSVGEGFNAKTLTAAFAFACVYFGATIGFYWAGGYIATEILTCEHYSQGATFYQWGLVTLDLACKGVAFDLMESYGLSVFEGIEATNWLSQSFNFLFRSVVGGFSGLVFVSAAKVIFFGQGAQQQQSAS